MFTCTFFGHADCPYNIEPKLRDAIIDLIENKNVTLFLVGAKGNFDQMVQRILCDLKSAQYKFDYNVIISKIPLCNSPSNVYPDAANNTLIIPELENVPPRFAIDFCNNYMLKTSDYVVTYIVRTFGGAAKFAAKATRQNKTVINIADETCD